MGAGYNNREPTKDDAYKNHITSKEIYSGGFLKLNTKKDLRLEGALTFQW